MNRKILLTMFVLAAAMMCALGASAAEAYVYYTWSDSTLTFYYDNLLYSRTGGLPGYLNEAVSNPYSGENDPDWLYDNFQLGIARVVFDSSFAGARPTTMYSWFRDMTNLRVIDGWENLNTSQVTSMNGVFYNCNKLTSIDLSHFNTDAVTFMPFMFFGCTKLTSIDLSNFNTAQVTNMEYMFSGCSKLTSVKLDSFNTQKVEYMGGMFENCGELTELNLGSFNTSKLINSEAMFNCCGKLTTIYVSNTWTNNKINYSSQMFYGCTSLVGGMGTTYDANHRDKTYARIDGGSSRPGYFTEKPNVEAYACYTSSNTTLTFYYDGQRASREGTTYSLNENGVDPSWLSGTGLYQTLTTVAFDPSFADARPTTTLGWFFGMAKLQTFTGMEYLNTTEVTEMGAMFYECDALTSLDLSSFNTAKVNNMGTMFYGCNNLTTIYAGEGWSTAAVTSSGYMFGYCTKLVGGMGTTYDANHVDAAYARIDGGPSMPGYFTEKVNVVLGDVNGDNNVDVDDVTALIAAVLSGTPVDPTAADVNGDNLIDVDDVTALIARILSGSW